MSYIIRKGNANIRKIKLIIKYMIMGIMTVLMIGCATKTGKKNVNQEAKITKEIYKMILRGDSLPTKDAFVEYDTPPEKISEVEYICPLGEDENQIKSTVWVKVLVDTLGMVRDALILKGDENNKECEEAAIDIAYKARWKPAKLKGKPVAIWVSYKIKSK